MNNFLVKTEGCLQYVFQANHFQIFNGILYFYDLKGDVVWVIKEWISFRKIRDEEVDGKMNADDFYEGLNKD